MTGFVLFAFLFAVTVAQPGRDNGRGTENLYPLKPGDDGSPDGKEKCSLFYRTLNGRCNNLVRKEWGSARQPLFSYYNGLSSVHPTGEHLRSPRFISNVLCKQDFDIFNRRGLSELVTFFGQFLDHNIVATSADENSKFDIFIPRDDPIFANFSGKLPFDRSKRAPVFEKKKKRVEERPMNTLSSYIDLSAVYGADNERIKSLRSYKDGKLATSRGDMMPFNEKGMFNAPTKDAKFFLAGDHRANEHPVLTSLHTIFVREHNLICDELKRAFRWKDEELFQMARQINVAQFQKIVFEEFYPMMTGRLLKGYKGYNRRVNAGVSNLFATAAFRIGHTMVGNGITRRGAGMSPMSTMNMMEMFFRQGEVMKSDGIEPFIRGAIFKRAQEIDLHVHDALRNFLFTDIPEEKGFDLIALNLQRSRDHALPYYIGIRKFFKIPKRLRSFKQITTNRIVQSKLATAYGKPSNVEAWIGLMAEDHIPGASMGPTMYRIWDREFSRLRDGDRFYFKRQDLFPDEVWAKVPRVKALHKDNELLRTIILRTTNISPNDIRGSVWKAVER